MSHFIFRIGPLPTSAGDVSAYFVFPGVSQHQVFFGSSDEAVLKQIVELFDPSELACEPSLAKAAQLHEIVTRDFKEDELKKLGILALELTSPGRFQSVQNEASIHHLATASTIFADASPWATSIAQTTILIGVTGSSVRSVNARILGSAGSAAGVVLFSDS
ncbi:MAG: hypothetical protein QOJ98_1215, partial [Acidobacteriota bacterium]|nr:hypothetical protein [Acidobacteriota bacterium]